MKKIDCETVRELLGNYIDEDLTELLRGSIEHHVAICKNCQADLVTLQNSVSSLQGATGIEPLSPWFAERLLVRIARETDTDLAGVDTPVKDLQLGLW